ncbi:MAG: hypothetical protein ATN31_05460 [Candidatus Epulonipiscioides saccharophilum]|nr:MAG: hypothetical protein ATN31_05460 [Epulopiscium sp. AS2M-Bin001]
MTNIFAILKNTDDEFIKHYIAMLEVMNTKNTAKIEINKLSRKSITFLNTLSSKSKINKEITLPKAQTIESLVEQKRQELSNLSRSKLNTKFKIILKSILNLPYTISDFALSVHIINFVAQKHKIDEYFTVSQKADAIYELYFGQLTENSNQTIQFNNISTEIVNRVLEKEDIFSNILSGHGFKTEIMSQLVFMAVALRGVPMTVSLDKLPSFEPNSINISEIENKHVAYLKLLAEKQRLQIRLTNNEAKQAQTLDDINNYQEVINNSLSEKSAVDPQISELQSQYDSMADKLRLLKAQIENLENTQTVTPEELDLLKSNYSIKENNLSDIFFKISFLEKTSDELTHLIPDKQESLIQLQLHLDDIQLEIYKIKSTLKNIKSDIFHIEETKINALEQKWFAAFPNFTLSKSCKKNLVQFNYFEILAIETSLVELYYASDKTSLSNGQSFYNSIYYQYIFAKASNGSVIQILYYPTGDSCELARFSYAIVAN